MTETGREGDSVYQHAYDDPERHSLKLTASKLPGMGHVAYRARPAGARTARRRAEEVGI
jgi:catechol 2,3-dioxygenase